MCELLLVKKCALFIYYTEQNIEKKLTISHTKKTCLMQELRTHDANGRKNNKN